MGYILIGLAFQLSGSTKIVMFGQVAEGSEMVYNLTTGRIVGSRLIIEGGTVSR